MNWLLEISVAFERVRYGYNQNEDFQEMGYDFKKAFMEITGLDENAFNRLEKISSETTAKKWICEDCGTDTFKNAYDYYVVQDHLWEKHGNGDGMLCIGCFAKRLGRPFRADDFQSCSCNDNNPLVSLLIKVL